LELNFNCFTPPSIDKIKTGKLTVLFFKKRITMMKRMLIASLFIASALNAMNTNKDYIRIQYRPDKYDPAKSPGSGRTYGWFSGWADYPSGVHNTAEPDGFGFWKGNENPNRLTFSLQPDKSNNRIIGEYFFKAGEVDRLRNRVAYIDVNYDETAKKINISVVPKGELPPKQPNEDKSASEVRALLAEHDAAIKKLIEEIAQLKNEFNRPRLKSRGMWEHRMSASLVPDII
jgi:hypothetical protein